MGGRLEMSKLDVSLFDGQMPDKECVVDGYDLVATRKIIYDYDAFNSLVSSIKGSGSKVYLFSYNKAKHLILWAIGSDLNRVSV